MNDKVYAVGFVTVAKAITLYCVRFPNELKLMQKLLQTSFLADPSDVSTPSCSITNDWKIQCSCNVTKAFSTRDRYSCQWFQNVGGQVSYI